MLSHACPESRRPSEDALEERWQAVSESEDIFVSESQKNEVVTTKSALVTKEEKVHVEYRVTLGKEILINCQQSI